MVQDVSKKIDLNTKNKVQDIINSDCCFNAKVSQVYTLIGPIAIFKYLKSVKLGVVKLTKDYPQTDAGKSIWFEMINWCNSHYGYSNYAVIGLAFVFNTAEDAVMFKLRFANYL